MTEHPRRVQSGEISTLITRWRQPTRYFLSFPLIFPTFSPPLPLPLRFSQHFCSSCFCGQQAFSLLSAESAKHSHFWTADRLELADRVERLLRKRDIKDEGKGGAREEVSRGKITSHGKNDKKKVFVFPLIEKYRQIRHNFFVFLQSQLSATACLLFGAAYRRCFPFLL